jgi:hypothetical protein
MRVKWMVRSAFLAVALAAVAVAILHPARRPPPATRTEFLQCTAPLGLTVRPEGPNDLYLADGSGTLSDLPVRARQFLPRWRGVVFAEYDPSGRTIDLDADQSCGARVGPWLLFGDPELLARVRQAVR